MATKIRLARAGAKKRPFYRIVVADVRAPRDGNFIEKIGTYNPLLKEEDANRVVFNKERAIHWLKTGATPTERVAIFFAANDIKEAEKYLPKSYPKTQKERDALIKKREDEKKKIEAEKQAKIDAEEAAKKAEADAAEAEAKKAEEEAGKTEAPVAEDAQTDKTDDKAPEDKEDKTA